jgi:ABC-type nickel/cobalt efflux system permease component RcnA/Tol biopolymer transport system component
MVLIRLLAAADSVRAHPADMYAQNQSISITPEGLQIEWKIFPGPILADAVWGAVAQSPDGAVSEESARAWVAPFVANLSVRLDGKSATAAEVQAVHWPSNVDVLRTGEDRISVSLHVAWPKSLHGTHTVELHNVHLEANSLNWFSLTAEQGVTFDQPSQSNGLLRVDLAFPSGSELGTTSMQSKMTSWTSGTPNLPDFSGAVSRLAGNLSGAPVSSTLAGSNPSSLTAALTGLVKVQQFSPWFLVGAFFLSLALGSLHALTPGHGKALVGAYLVGAHGKTRDAVLLGAIVTITHTGSVVLLGLVTLFASHYILPALIAPWLEIISGVLVIGFGLNLLVRRRHDLSRSLPKWIKVRGSTETTLAGGHAQSHAGHWHDQTHAHGLDGNRAHKHHEQHGHAHANDEAHEHAHVLPDQQVTLKSLLALGVSGGLVPCPDAIAILLVAVAINRIPFGMLLIASFSIGLALVLIGIGIAMVNGARLMARSDLLARFGDYAPLVSAVVVTGLGVGLTWSAMNSLKFSTAVAQGAAGAPPVTATSATAASPSETRKFDLDKARLLYVASDKTGWDQLFIQPLSGGSAEQLTSESLGITSYSVSPDRNTILYTLFTAQDGTAIWSLNSDGSGKRLALDCPVSECNSPRWYPDGQKVAYERLDNGQTATVPRFSIWWLDLVSGKTQPVFQDRSLASYGPEFSPNGQWLSYISAADNTLIIFGLQDGRSLSVPLGFHAANPETWSPTGEAVLFGNEAEAQDWAPLRTRIYTLATGKLTDLGGPESATDFSADWSPEGSWIAIDRNVLISSSQNSNQVWLVKPDGTQAHVLLDEEGASYSSLNWSPDGHNLVYSRYTLDASAQNPGHFDVYLTDITTGSSRLLVKGGDMPTLLP